MSKKWLFNLIEGLVLKYADDLIADVGKKNEAIKKACEKIEENGNLYEVVEAVIETTTNLRDDELLDKAEEVVSKIRDVLVGKPIKEIVEEYLVPIKIPDFDDDPTNNVSLGEYLLGIIKMIGTPED